MDTAVVAAEIQRTWNRPDAAQCAEACSLIFPHYRLLIESYPKANTSESTQAPRHNPLRVTQAR